jgi:hypothetical protein
MKKSLNAKAKAELLQQLKARFEHNMQRHKNIEWSEVQLRLEKQSDKLWSLNEMEMSGGEPDVTGINKKSSAFIFTDCAAESPSGRRSLCYDHEALNKRKENKPKDSVIHMAETMGVQILNEEQYRSLQQLGLFDIKTSSWILTPNRIRALGGALFCDRRYDTIFTYHNSAESYYAARGFRAFLEV